MADRLRRALPMCLGVVLLVSIACSSEDPGAEAEPGASAAAAAHPRAGAKQEPSATEKLKAYYESATGGSDDPEPSQLDDSIVRCRLPSGHQFLRRYDCDLRGGSVAS